MESRLVDAVATSCPVGTTRLFSLSGLTKHFRQLQLGLEVTAGTPANITGVTLARGVGPHPAVDAARSAAALAALSAGAKYDLAVDGLDVLDALVVSITTSSAPVTVTATVLAETRS